MKIITAVSIVLIVLVSFLFLYGLFSDEQSEVSAEIIIEAPASVPLNHLMAFSEYALWTDLIKPLNFDPKRNIRKVTYFIDERPFTFNEEIHLFQTERALALNQIDGFRQSYIRNIRQHISIKSLPDGTASVRWNLRYEIPSVTGRILNPLTVAPRFRRFVAENLSNLKTYIER